MVHRRGRVLTGPRNNGVGAITRDAREKANVERAQLG